MDVVFGKVTEIGGTETDQASAGNYLLVAGQHEQLQLTEVLDSHTLPYCTVCER